jgi:hypothetical protein
MTRRVLPRLLAAAASIAALAAALTVVAGTGFAQSNTAAQANYAPTNTTKPTISGTAQTGQTLTASQGSWTSDSMATFTYQWMSCDAQGNNCANIANATNQTYAVQSGDVGKTIRVTVTAKNASGSTPATSAQTGVVTTAGSSNGGGTQGSTTSVAASTVVLPDRLVIDNVKFSPTRVDTRSTFTGRFHVSETQGGKSVSGALVSLTALPYAWGKNVSGEVQTDSSGWATLSIRPSVSLPLGKHVALVMFVRARVQGQPVLAGSSVRRLVQIRVR